MSVGFPPNQDGKVRSLILLPLSSCSLSTGFGASSVVHQGVFKPLDRACAIKVIDLEAYGRDTEELRRETQLMSLSKHPNVLRVRGCWVKGAKLSAK